MSFLRGKGRYFVATVALAIAFALSVQLGERGVQFDLSHASVSAEEGGDEAYRLSSLRIFNRALLQIKEKYVDPDRIDPTQMLVAALDSVQNEIPEFVVNYEDLDEDGQPTTLEIQVVDERRTFELRSMESMWEMSLRLKEIFSFVERHLPDDPERDIQDIEYAAINGMVTTLDPHSGLLTPTHYEEMQTQTGGEFGGLGIVISIQDDELTVISPIDGTPAARKGIRSQDRIVRIGEESTVNMNLNEAVNRLRGEPGTEIDVWVKRDGWSEPRQFTIERAIIEIESVESEPLDDKIGYLRVNNFQANTYPDMRTHLQQLRETMGGIDGLILDMRDNPGGLLDQSVHISNLFLEDGPIVSTVGHGDTLRDTQEASPTNTEPDYPIIVLVNEGSASASEIVAGALQQNDRAVVLGDITFGKGTVQILYEFPDDSALKLTVAQYLTPDGASIQNTGIIPDLQTIPVSIQPGKVSLFRSQLMQRERDMDRALENPSTRPDDDGPLSLIRYLDEEAFDDEVVDDPNEFDLDFAISLSSQLLSGIERGTNRTAMLEALQGDLEEVFEREMTEIQSKLADLDIDWTPGSSPEEPSYEFQVRSTADDEAVLAGESVEVTASLTNRSDEALHRVKALTRSDNFQLRHQEFIFGRVEPGETREWTIEFDIPQDTKNRHDRIEFKVSDDDGEFAGDHHYDLLIKGKERPHYAFTYELMPDEIVDGLLRPGDEVTLRVHLENLGQQTGDDTSLYLKNLTGEEVYLDKGRAVIEGLEPGASESADLLFEISGVPDDGYVTFELDVYDSGYREFFQREFRLPVVEESSQVEELEGLATVGEESASLFVSTDEKSDRAARVSAGASLPVIARSGDEWFKVELDERRAWIRGSDISFEEGATGELSGVERIMRFQKPQVALNPSGLFTTDSFIELEGLIEDEWDIQDYYIMVHHREGPMDVETRKLAYQNVGSTQAELSTDVPLFEGMNQISLVTRNNAGISTTETIYVYRE